MDGSAFDLAAVTLRGGVTPLIPFRFRHLFPASRRRDNRSALDEQSPPDRVSLPARTRGRVLLLGRLSVGEGWSAPAGAQRWLPKEACFSA